MFEQAWVVPPVVRSSLTNFLSKDRLRANGLDLWDGHCSNRQRNGQGLAELTCADKIGVGRPFSKFRIVYLRGLAQMWVPTWGSSRVDVGADVVRVGLGRCDGSRTKTSREDSTRVRFLTSPRPVSPFCFLERGVCGPFPGQRGTIGP